MWCRCPWREWWLSVSTKNVHWRRDTAAACTQRPWRRPSWYTKECCGSTFQGWQCLDNQSIVLIILTSRYGLVAYSHSLCMACNSSLSSPGSSSISGWSNPSMSVCTHQHTLEFIWTPSIHSNLVCVYAEKVMEGLATSAQVAVRVRKEFLHFFNYIFTELAKNFSAPSTTLVLHLWIISPLLPLNYANNP